MASLVVITVAAVASHRSPPAGSSSTGARSGGSSVTGSSSQVPPAPGLSLTAAVRTVVPGALPGMPWPKAGEAAIGVQGSGIIATSRRQPEVPIASVTKVMTALIVLRDHPLVGDSVGPTFEMTEQDAIDFQDAAGAGDSSLLVVPGERLDERQLLEALLIPSADNIADYLARWDAGSIPAFVARMNAEAAALGMTSTHYADASGLDPKSRSTAADQVRLAAVAMADPVFASIVRIPTLNLPHSSEMVNYNPIIGIDGVVGVKSGFTNAAAGCLVAAAWRQLGGHEVLLISAVLGQPLGLYQAGDADRKLLDAVTPLLELRSVVEAGTAVADVHVPWSSHKTPAEAGSAANLVVWPGAVVEVSLEPAHGSPPWVAKTSTQQGSAWTLPAATRLGDLDVSMNGTPVTSVPVRLEGSIDGPPAGWSSSSG